MFMQVMLFVLPIILSVITWVGIRLSVQKFWAGSVVDRYMDNFWATFAFSMISVIGWKLLIGLL